MSRQIVIDEDTLVGYDFQTKRYYVINKGTKTYRSDIQTKTGTLITGEHLIKEVLNIVAPDNTVTEQQLRTQLYLTTEKLTDLYYTISNIGSYFTSVQINDYSDNTITLEAEKSVLYIRNTELSFNLKLNESRESRVLIIVSYFLDNFGVELTVEEVTNIYNFLINNDGLSTENINKPCYAPSVYNVIGDTSTDPIVYSNVFRTSNFDDKAVVQYSCTDNPNNIFYSVNSADIVGVEPSYNRILFINPTTDVENLKEGDTIGVQGTTVQEETYSYSADGSYGVQSIDLTKTPCELTVTEALSASYVFPYPQAYIPLATTGIVSIDREASSITLSSSISNVIETGDVVEVTDTQVQIEGTTVSCNGKYTVSEVNTATNTLYVQEIIPTSYTYSGSGIQGQLSKNRFIGNVNSILLDEDTNYSIISLTKDSPVSLSNNQTIFIDAQDNSRTYYTTVISSPLTNNIQVEMESYTGEEPLLEYTPVYPQLTVSIPDTSILINVEQSSNTGLLPTGSFMVDNFQQCRQYLGLYTNNNLVPSQEVYENIGKEVGLDITEQGLTYKYLGIFDKVYPSEE